MTAKKKRRRNRGQGSRPAAARPQPEQQRSSSGATTRAKRTDRGNGRSRTKTETRPADEPRPRGFFAGGRGFGTGTRREPQAGDLVFPPPAASLVRGLRATARSAPALALTFLVTLALWGAYQALGARDALSPRAMSLLLSLPPLHSTFLEFQALQSLQSSTVALLGTAAAFTLVRMAVFGALIAMVAEGLGWDRERPLRAWSRAIPHLMLIGLAFFGVSLAVPLLLQGLLGPQLGLLGALLALAFGVYFLIFAPVAAVVDGLGYREAVRASVRAARTPGSRHLTMSLGYVVFALFIASVAPTSAVSPATPSILTWAFTLLVSYLHVGVLAAFTYRWVAARELEGDDS